MAALRSIAITIEEAEEGGFVWVLLEQVVEWSPIKRAEQPTKSYARAMADGLLALQVLIADLDAGPREPASTGSPVKREKFGFGFGLLK
jgi:hypothetical protein